MQSMCVGSSHTYSRVPLHQSLQNIREQPRITDSLQTIRNPCRWVTAHPTARPAKAGSIFDIFPQNGLFLSGCPEISVIPAGTQRNRGTQG